MRIIFAAVAQETYRKLKPMVDRFSELVGISTDWIHDKLPKDMKIDWEKLDGEEAELNFRIYTMADLSTLRTATLHGYTGEEKAFQDLRMTLRLLNPEGAKTLRLYRSPLFSVKDVQSYSPAYRRFLAPINLETAIREHTELFIDGYSEEMGDPYPIYVRAQQKYMDVLTVCFQNHHAFLVMSDGTP